MAVGFQQQAHADPANHADRFAAPKPSAQFVESALRQLVFRNGQTRRSPITRIVLPLRSQPRDSWNPRYGSWFSETAKRGGRQSRGSFCRSGAIRAIREIRATAVGFSRNNQERGSRQSRGSFCRSGTIRAIRVGL
jgi:hypothetical protein